MADKVEPKVVDLIENMPHFCIIGPKSEPHVIPVVAIHGMATGRLPLMNEGQEDIDGDMIRGIIADWLWMQDKWSGYKTRVKD
jgi:hypothetical protein